MRKPFRMFALVLLLVVPAIRSFAQYGDDEQSKLAFRGGVHRPSGSRLRDEASLWKAFGFDYILSFDKPAGRPVKAISVDYAGSSKGHMDASMFGLQYVRLWSKSPLPDKGFYYGAGAGLFLVGAQVDEAFFQPAVDESGMKLGATLLGGYSLGSYWQAEIRYSKLGSLASGVDLSGLSFYVVAKRFL